MLKNNETYYAHFHNFQKIKTYNALFLINYICWITISKNVFPLKA